jgi:hypothetical protein
MIMALQAASFRQPEDIIEDQMLKSIAEVEDSINVKGICPAHGALARNAILQTQVLGIGVSYLRSPLIKLVTLILTLGGSASIALLIKVVIAMLAGDKVAP